MEWYKNVECTDAKLVESTSKEEFKSNENYQNYKFELLDMLSELRDMWYRHLGQASAVKQRTGLK